MPPSERQSGRLRQRPRRDERSPPASAWRVDPVPPGWRGSRFGVRPASFRHRHLGDALTLDALDGLGADANPAPGQPDVRDLALANPTLDREIGYVELLSNLSGGEPPIHPDLRQRRFR